VPGLVTVVVTHLLTSKILLYAEEVARATQMLTFDRFDAELTVDPDDNWCKRANERLAASSHARTQRLIARTARRTRLHISNGARVVAASTSAPTSSLSSLSSSSPALPVWSPLRSSYAYR
jgi:hypothetical protein